jgi:K+-sensing histidine kinase KdpD
MSKSGPLWSSESFTILHYAVAVLSVAAALIAGLLLDTFLQTSPFVSLFLCAIIFVAWLGGIGPGLLAVVLSVLTFTYYEVAPFNSVAVVPNEIPRVVLFTVAALFVALLTARQRSATESLRRTRDELQGAVEGQRRTEGALRRYADAICVVRKELPIVAVAVRTRRRYSVAGRLIFPMSVSNVLNATFPTAP